MENKVADDLTTGRVISAAAAGIGKQPAGGMKKSYRPFAIPSSLAFVSVSGVVTADELHANNTGLKTYEKVAVLPDVLTDSTAYIERAFYYDKDGLLVQTVIRNHLGGINRLSNRYDDAGNQLISYESRATGPGVSPDILQTRMTYDDFGRVLTEQKRLGNGPIAKVSYRYDALGRVSTMIQGAGKINTSYKYDIAGRTTEQQNELFRMTLATDKPTLAGIPKNYAGQIGECSWSFAGDGYFTSYGYRYTPMGQLQDARTYRNGQLQVASYAEMDLKYDHNDNILSLTRYGNKRIVNDIQYVYDGNRLISTTDNGRTTTYGYDLNGNVISTPENACSYGYNYLNLVEEVRRNGSVAARYKYLADGTKLEVSDAMGCGFLYFGSLIYSKRGTIYTPESVGFTGGRIVCTSAGSEVQYHVTDYLGSVRVVADQNGRALEKINYYPFGKRWDAADLPISGNRYLFNGKEWQATGAVNLLDYGARMYDPNLGRWFVQDPMYQMHNPYTFCASDPVNKIDPNGMMTDWVQDNDSGEILWIDNAISPETTPPGYSYLGPSIDDILRALGIYFPKSFRQYAYRSFYGWLTEDDKSRSQMLITGFGLISITPDISISPENRSVINQSGITFNGIKIGGNFGYDFHSTTGAFLRGMAYLTFSYGSKSYRVVLQPTSSFIGSKGLYLDGSILIPATEISPTKTFSKATITFPIFGYNSSYAYVTVTRGFLNPFAVKPIIFTWVFQNPVIY